jgi:hypothetical protein
MRIMTDRPSPLAWALTSSDSTAALAAGSSYSYLTDGKVALPTRISWTTGTPATSDSITLNATFPSSPALMPEWFAVLLPRTPYAPPAGMKIVVLGVRDGGISVVLGGTTQTQRVVMRDDGALLLIVRATSLAPPGGHTWQGFRVQIFNDVNGSVYFGPGQSVDVGEIWCGTGAEFKIGDDAQFGMTDPTTNRRSHSNQPWPLYVKPYNTWTFKFVPMSDSAAYAGSANSFAAVRYQVATALAVLVLPRYLTPGTTTLNTTDLHQLAVFGRPESINALQAVQGAHLWTAAMVVGEAPP